MDGGRIVSSSYDGTLRIWNVLSGNEITAISAHEQRIGCCQFSRDGNLLVSCSEDRTIRVWDAIAGREVSRLQGHSGAIESVKFHPDQKAIVSAGQDGTVRVWNMVNEGARGTGPHRDSVNECVYTSDGRYMLSCSRDRTLKVWYCVDMVAIATIRAHEKSVNSCGILNFVPGGRSSVDDKMIAVSVSDDSTIRIWSIVISRGSSASYSLVKEYSAPSSAVKSVATSPNGKEFYTGGWDSKVLRWSISNMSVEGFSASSSEMRTQHTDWINCVTVSNIGEVASASHDGSVQTVRARMHNHGNWVLACCYSPDSRLIASASYDTTLAIANAGGKLLRNLKGHSERVNKCCFLTDNILLSASSDRFVMAWDVKTGDIIAEFECKGPVTALHVSPLQNGHFVVGDSLGNVEFLHLIQ